MLKVNLKQLVTLLAVCAVLDAAGQTGYQSGQGHTHVEFLGRDIDESKAVGTLAGVAGVSPTGAATYSIEVVDLNWTGFRQG